MAFLAKFFAFMLAWALVKGSIRKDKILFLQKSPAEKNEILLVMTWTENEGGIKAGCEIFTNEGLIDEILTSNDTHIRTLSEYEMQMLLGDCIEFNHQRRKRDTGNVASMEVSPEDAENECSEWSSTNRRKSNKRSRSGNKSNRSTNGPGNRPNRSTNGPGNRPIRSTNGPGNRSTNRRKQQGSKPNKTTATTSPSTTAFSNEIAGDHDKQNKEKEFQDRVSSKSEVEHESEESFKTVATTAEPSTTLGYDGLPIILPGTKWCGAGDIAEHYDDLGRHVETDVCCRAHDHCDDFLAPGETRYNLTNTSSFTKLSCRCDEEFYNCLGKVRTITANTIGNMYFNILRRDCYMPDHPPSNTCKRYLTLFKLTCLEYEKDTSKEKIYQWFPPKRFRRSKAM